MNLRPMVDCFLKNKHIGVAIRNKKSHIALTRKIYRCIKPITSEEINAVRLLNSQSDIIAVARTISAYLPFCFLSNKVAMLNHRIARNEVIKGVLFV